MSERIDLDLVIDASEEAKICLNCGKKKCTPAHCKRLNDKLKELKQKGTQEK